MRRLAACALATVWLAGSPRAAEAATRVGLARESGQEELAARIRRELVFHGFEVMDLPAPKAGEAPKPSPDLPCALVKVITGDVVEIWVVGGTEEGLVRQMTLTRSAPSRAAASLRAVEALRTTLVDRTCPKPAPEPPRPIVRLEVAPLALWSPGGVPPMAHGFAALSLTMPWGGGLRLFAALPTTPARITARGGSADLRLTMVGGGPSVTVTLLPRLLHLEGEAGLSAMWFHVAGLADRDFVGSEGDLVTAAPYLRSALDLAISPRLWAHAGLLVATSLARPVIRFDDAVVAHFGPPTLGASFGLGFQLQ